MHLVVFQAFSFNYNTFIQVQGKKVVTGTNQICSPPSYPREFFFTGRIEQATITVNYIPTTIICSVSRRVF